MRTTHTASLLRPKIKLNKMLDRNEYEPPRPSRPRAHHRRLIRAHKAELLAILEARWQADRERCWRAFLRNAARVQGAPEGEREALVARYRAEAERRYGERTALDMAQSLASWVRGQGVH